MEAEENLLTSNENDSYAKSIFIEEDLGHVIKRDPSIDLKKLVNFELKGICSTLENLSSRCDNFGDLMNESSSRTKLDEKHEQIKNILREAYSDVRMTQSKIIDKVNQVKQLTEQTNMLKKELSNSCLKNAPFSTMQETLSNANKDQLDLFNDQIDLLNTQENIDLLVMDSLFESMSTSHVIDAIHELETLDIDQQEISTTSDNKKGIAPSKTVHMQNLKPKSMHRLEGHGEETNFGAELDKRRYANLSSRDVNFLDFMEEKKVQSYSYGSHSLKNDMKLASRFNSVGSLNSSEYSSSGHSSSNSKSLEDIRESSFKHTSTRSKQYSLHNLTAINQESGLNSGASRNSDECNANTTITTQGRTFKERLALAGVDFDSLGTMTNTDLINVSFKSAKMQEINLFTSIVVFFIYFDVKIFLFFSFIFTSLKSFFSRI